MTCNILYLYPDLMNLYGDNGNIRGLQRHLEDQGVQVQVRRVDPEETPCFAHVNLIYMGSGTERSQKAALKALLPHTEALSQAVEGGTLLLFTGNSMELLGRSITAADGTVYEGLGLGDFTTTERGDTRDNGDVLYQADFLKRPLVGYVNKSSQVHGVKTPLFQVLHGAGNAQGEPEEGFHQGNLWGTHVTGPILLKNPELMIHVLQRLGEGIPGFSYRAQEYPNMENAYEVTLRELTNRFEGGQG